MKKAVIILPTYNEAKNIQIAIEGILNTIKDIQNWNVDILVVNSNSPDNTADVVKTLQKKYKKNLYLLETPREGLGKAYVRGFKYAIDEMKAYIVFEMDADLSHDPALLPQFLQQIEQGSDFVIGSRYRKDGSIPEDWALHRKLLSVLGNWIIRLGFMQLKITDWTSGFRAIKAWIVKDTLPLLEGYSGYVFQVALLDNAVRLKARVSEVPLVFVDRKEGVSKMSSMQYTLQTLFYVFTHSSFVKFVIVGGLGFIIDITLFFYFATIVQLATWQANLISTETALISNFLLNNFWSFSHKKVDHAVRSYIFNFLKFNVISSGSIFIQVIGLELLKYFFGPEYLFLYKVGVIIFLIIPYSYFFYNKVVWKDK